MGPSEGSVSLTIQLLGKPRLTRTSGHEYVFRSRKSWAVLALLLLSERPLQRGRLSELLYADADDPARALRWSLTEIRRGLGSDAAVDGDPVVLQLGPDVVVDVEAVRTGAWAEAVTLPGLGADLLEGLSVRGAAGFETWLLSERRHFAAASEAILHEAALGSLSKGRLPEALGYAVRATAMSPLDENHHALLIKLYRLSGDHAAAQRQFMVCSQILEQELGVRPGPAVNAAMREPRAEPGHITGEAALDALVESGSAAVSAGAFQAGVASLRSAAGLADRANAPRQRVAARLGLAEALIHSLRGFDEEGVAALYEADEIAQARRLVPATAQVRAELGYVDLLRARYDRAEVWLTDALTDAPGSSPVRAKALTYLGTVESDRANYARAVTLLHQAIADSRAVDDPRRAAYALSMLGRVELLCGDLESAADRLEESMTLAQRHHWLAFIPWAQGLRGEVQLARGDASGGGMLLEQAFARACQLGDPCWEGLAARGLGLVADAQGRADAAFEILDDARLRNHRFAEPYLWLDVYILDAQCGLGVRHGHAMAATWVRTMQELASRTGMRELTVRALLHGAALGIDGDAEAASLLAAEVDNPSLHSLVRVAS